MSETGNGAGWLQKWLPVGAAAVVVGGVVATYFVGQGATQNTIDNLKAANAQLERKVQKLEGANGQVQGQIASMRVYNCQQFTTVEIQMATVETLLNKTQAVNERDTARLWQKAFAQDYPDIFYPVSIPHEAPKC